jgi:very-short-patch-repair endonuclease
MRVLTPALTVADCAFTRPLHEAVVVADSALRTCRVSLQELERVTEAAAQHPQGRRLRHVLDLVDPASGSVLESLCRLLLVQHGLRPESQVTLADRLGRTIGRVDFLFRNERLVVECDGRRWHDPSDARERDRVRDNELERAGWRLVRVTWHDVVHRPDYVMQLVQDCLAPWPNAA